ncbi:PKD domain-containing protein [Mucilaginibacter paludis]|uniref:PKD domain-containing protein n=1 Tax=Mucilaginibacter paludis TaxID=423351 RepID=UPI00058D62D2|nr:PKD domain-containing protein [Mucilaginibacter paludis]
MTLYGATPGGGFTAVPNITGYSYGQFSVAKGATHVLSANQGFNAIAYEFGEHESYGYAAGTNVKNLNEYVQFLNPNTSKVESSSCTASTLIPQIVLPYSTPQLIWNFGNNAIDTVSRPAKTTITKTEGSNTTVLYQYTYGKPITYSNAGTYNIKVTAIDTITTLCGSTEDIYLSFTIVDPPAAKFTSRDTVCTADTVGFKDLTIGNTVKTWHWDFGNGDTSAVQNPVYHFLQPGKYKVTLTVAGTTGCANSVFKYVYARPLPILMFPHHFAIHLYPLPLLISPLHPKGK